MKVIQTHPLPPSRKVPRVPFSTCPEGAINFSVSISQLLSPQPPLLVTTKCISYWIQKTTPAAIDYSQKTTISPPCCISVEQKEKKPANLLVNLILIIFRESRGDSLNVNPALFVVIPALWPSRLYGADRLIESRTRRIEYKNEHRLNTDLKALETGFARSHFNSSCVFESLLLRVFSPRKCQV